VEQTRSSLPGASLCLKVPRLRPLAHRIKDNEQVKTLGWLEAVALRQGNNISISKYANPVPTAQKTHSMAITKPNRLMLFREIIAVYCENHMEHINTLCGQNAEFLNAT
jgi:hypothetical protein